MFNIIPWLYQVRMKSQNWVDEVGSCLNLVETSTWMHFGLE